LLAQPLVAERRLRADPYRRGGRHPAHLVPDPASVRRLVLLGFSVGDHDLDSFVSLEECYLDWRGGSQAAVTAAEARGVTFIPHRVDI
jgi:hypothetical protein